MEKLEEQRLIRQYLLGAVGEKEQQQIEERILTDPRYKAEVLMSEDELMEDYASGLLSEGEREKFVKHCLPASGQIEKLRITKALLDYANSETRAETPLPVNRSDGPPFWRRPLTARFSGRRAFAAVAVSLILIIVTVVLFYLGRSQQPTRRLAAQRAFIAQELARLNRQQDPTTGLPPGLDPARARFLSVPLTSTLNRASGEMPRVSVPAQTNILQLRPVLTSESYRTYQATLSTIEGDELFTFAPLQPVITDGNRTLIINVPNGILTRGDYLLKLRGATENGASADADEYPFRIAN